MKNFKTLLRDTIVELTRQRLDWKMLTLSIMKTFILPKLCFTPKYLGKILTIFFLETRPAYSQAHMENKPA